MVRSLQLGPSVLDVAVALLGLVDYRAYLLLGQVSVLAQVSHSDSVIHRLLLTSYYDVKSLTYSKNEY